MPPKNLAGRLAAALCAQIPALALGLLLVAPAWAIDQLPADADQASRMRAIKQVQRQMLSEGPLRHMRAAREYRQWLKTSKRHPGRKGLRSRPASEEEEGSNPSDMAPGVTARSPRLGIASTLSVPANVRVNDPTSDGSGNGQSEQSVASWGQYVLVAWNDGLGFVPASGMDSQGFGYSTDGGATFVDGGYPPHPTSTKWTSDPIVTVNEKTGEFYYCGLLSNAGANLAGIGVVRATFSGSTLTWDTPHVVRTVPATNNFLDKQWMVADSLTGNLYLSYTKFDASDSIMFQRSTDQGVTWGPVLQLSSNAAAGAVQGSRPVVGPNGEVYVVWSELGPVDVDYFRIRRSVNQGVTFTPEATVSAVYGNFGTGAPGFNRERGITFPAIAVDRTAGPNRGRLYATWNESVNWYDDALGTAGSKVEVEPNNNTTSATATVFTPGQQLRGAFSASTDPDYFQFDATAGTTYIFWCDSIPKPLYTMRVLCSDGATRLAYAGDVNSPPGGNAFIVWTAPTTAAYFLRMTMLSGSGSLTGGYHILTGVDAPSAGEWSRDGRDVMVRYSDNGTVWSAPIRANDDAGLYDNWLPEVAVAGDGCPYVTWLDWRDALADCGGSSHTYLSRSTDGGATWAANQRVSDVTTQWSVVSSNIAPNQGDYQALYAGGRSLRPAWADGRLGTPDVFTTALDIGHDLTSCPNDTTVDHGTVLPLTFSFANRNGVFANDYTVTLSDLRGWLGGAPSIVTVPAASGQSLNFNVTVPDSAASGSNQLCLNVLNAKGTLAATCCVHLNVNGGTLAVGPGQFAFALHQSRPNPAIGQSHLSFTLPSSGPVRLEVYGLRGERIRTLVNASLPAGQHSTLWDGRDDHGNRVAAGTYFYRLQGSGRVATQRMVFLP